MMEDSHSKTFPVTARKGKYNSFQFSLTVIDFLAI